MLDSATIEEHSRLVDEANRRSRAFSQSPLVSAGWDFIHPQIAVGGCNYTPEEYAHIEWDCFTCVFSMRTEDISKRDMIRENFRLLKLHPYFINCPLEDNLLPKFDNYMLWSAMALAVRQVRMDRKILIHCTAGFNRAPSAAYGVLRLLGYNMRQAVEAIRTRRVVGLAYLAESEVFVSEMKENI